MDVPRYKATYYFLNYWLRMHLLNRLNDQYAHPRLRENMCRQKLSTQLLGRFLFDLLDITLLLSFQLGNCASGDQHYY